MSTRMLIDARHPEETRVTVVKGSRVEDFDYESTVRRQLKGNIYLARVTRVEPSLQAAFVEYGGNRHGFLAFSEIHPDYYQIPLEDREAIIEAETQAAAAEQAAEDDAEEAEAKKRRPRRRRGRKPAAEKTTDSDATISEEASEAPESSKKVAESATENQQDNQAPSDADEIATPEKTEAENPAVEGKKTAPDENSDTDNTDNGEESGADDADVKESEEEDKDAEIEAAAASRRRNLRALKRRYSIQEVIKRRQVLLIQVVKEERGNKGAALTTYMSLAGRYCVLMPNSTHSGGISRKISNLGDRKKLKQVINSLNVPEDMGLIVRTAGINRTKTEIKRDYDYLLRLWNGIRDLTLKSTAPALIYEEGNLIKRTIRDVYTRDIDEIWVEGEKGYRAAKDFMKLLMPSHAKKVQHYRDRIPLYHRYQVENQLEAMYQPVVQLKSGGYIVINPTEALISIDVNSGRATKEHNIEETATKTNLEAAEEVARQLRLRDMAGLVVIDFIDMEDRSNNRSVERRMKEMLKHDRARIQVGRISSFGLMEMSRQRLRPNLLEVAMETCTRCSGTGLVRSVESAALMALRQLEEEGIRNRSNVVRVNTNPDVAIYLLNQKRSVLSDLESEYKFTIQVMADTTLGASDIEITRETATEEKPQRANEGVVVKMDSSASMQPDGEDEKSEKTVEHKTDSDNDEQPRKKRRRRRRRRRGGSDDLDSQENSQQQNQEPNATTEDESSEQNKDAAQEEKPETTPRRRRGSRGGRRRRSRDEEQSGTNNVADADASTSGTESTAEATPDAPIAAEDEASEKPVRRRRRVKKTATPNSDAINTNDDNRDTRDTVENTDTSPEVSEEAKKTTRRTPRRRTPKKDSIEQGKPTEKASPDASEGSETTEKAKPRRRRRKTEDSSTETSVKDSTAKTTEEKTDKPRRRRAPTQKSAEKSTSIETQADSTSSVKKATPRRKVAAKADGASTKTSHSPSSNNTAASESPPASPEQPKKKGWWQRTFG